jgi:hypothetical protein
VDRRRAKIPCIAKHISENVSECGFRHRLVRDATCFGIFAHDGSIQGRLPVPQNEFILPSRDLLFQESVERFKPKEGVVGDCYVRSRHEGNRASRIIF